MRLVSFDGGFSRLEGSQAGPMGPDLVAYLEHHEAADSAPISGEQISPLAPVPRPGKIIGIGLNYRDHANESGQPGIRPLEAGETTIASRALFAKFANSVIGRP